MADVVGNSTETIALNFFDTVKEDIYEKPEIKTAVDAEITSVSDIKYNPENGEGANKKDNRPYKKLYFTVVYLLKEPIGDRQEIYESYGFRFYEDKKTVWWGTENSACGKLVNKLKKYTKNMPENPSVKQVIEALIGRKVKIVTETFGPNKSKKVMVDVFL